MKHFPSQGKSFWGFRYALEGLYCTIREESHMRFHICAAIGTTMFTEYYDFSKYDYGLLFIAIAFVLITELANTSAEHLVDLCTDEYKTDAKKAKDTAAAFVLVAAMFSLAVAYILFFDTKILFPSLLNIFTRPKYIIFFVLTVLFVIKGGKNER